MYCNCEIKLLKLKANYNNYQMFQEQNKYCNCEIKLLKLKANYNSQGASCGHTRL